jgi:hypothetical protein
MHDSCSSEFITQEQFKSIREKLLAFSQRFLFFKELQVPKVLLDSQDIPSVICSFVTYGASCAVNPKEAVREGLNNLQSWNIKS